ncbi:hypothetical protein D3C74_297110 [compost metagenome]
MRPGLATAARAREANEYTPSEPSAATTPCSAREASGWSRRTTSPPCSSARCSLWNAIHPASSASSAALAARRSHSTPRCPNSAVIARKDSAWTLPVVCEAPDATWAPTSSGGTSWPVHRLIC